MSPSEVSKISGHLKNNLQDLSQVLVPSFLRCTALFCLQDIIASQMATVPDSVQFCFLMSRGYIYTSGIITL